MPQIKSIPTIIQLAKISQFLAQNDVAKNIFYKGSDPNEDLPAILYMERSAVENMYNTNPSHEGLREAANYLYTLCGKYEQRAQVVVSNLTLGAPTVTGPDDESATVGDSVSFVIAVTSSLPYTVAWFKNGALISGETSTTLTLTAALADSGAEYHAVVTNSAGSTLSDVATLTVTAALVGSYYVGDTDYYSALSGGTDAITYLGTFNVTAGSPMSVSITTAALGNNKSHVYKFPASWGTPTVWANADLVNGQMGSDLNSGQIPDQAFREIVTIGSWKYIISRGQISFDTTKDMTFS